MSSAENAGGSSLRCNNPSCLVAKTGRCARASEFAEWEQECPDLQRLKAAGTTRPTTEATTSASTATELTQSSATPFQLLRTFWSGDKLTWSEGNQVLSEAPGHLIGVIGLSNAGKTSFLTSLFLQLAGGHRRELPYRVAGSLTLPAFEALYERAARLSPQNEGDGGERRASEKRAGEKGFSDKTSESLDPTRDPLFLHLALKPESFQDNRVIHLLMPDYSGEWFKRWVEHPIEQMPIGLKNLTACDSYLLLIDAPQLMTLEGRFTIRVLRQLMERLGHLLEQHPRPRRLALVLTKLDSEGVKAELKEPFQRPEDQWGLLSHPLQKILSGLHPVPGHQLETGIFGTSAFPCALSEGQPWGMIAPLQWLMADMDQLTPVVKPAHRFRPGPALWNHGVQDEENV